MTGFAIHMRVLALALYVKNVAVARFAGLVPGKLDRMRGNVRHGIAAVMSVPSEAFGNHVASNYKKDDESENEQSCEPEQMSRILKGAHCSPISRPWTR